MKAGGGKGGETTACFALVGKRRRNPTMCAWSPVITADVIEGARVFLVIGLFQLAANYAKIANKPCDTKVL